MVISGIFGAGLWYTGYRVIVKYDTVTYISVAEEFTWRKSLQRALIAGRL